MLHDTMRLCHFIAMAGLCLAACRPAVQPRAPYAQGPEERIYLAPQVGFSVAIPAAWDQQDLGASQVWHGPAGTDAYYATLTLQHRPTLGASRLDESVAHALASISHAPGFTWDALELGYVGQDLALGYSVRFNALEATHCQYGRVFVHESSLVGITLSAPEALCPTLAPVFDRIVDSLTTFRTAPTPPFTPRQTR